MFHILKEDIGKVQGAIDDVINTLTCGNFKVSRDVDVGDGLNPIIVTGYWVNEVMRIDIRIKK